MNLKQIILTVFIICIGIGAWVIIFQVQEQKVIDSFSIIISQDEDFSSFGFLGFGTEEHPYILEGKTINSEGSGIRIANTTKYCVIKDCQISSKGTSIQIFQVQSGTISILDNHLRNGEHGIEVEDTDTISILNNLCEYNQESGIILKNSSHSTITNNTCQRNRYGISLIGSSNNLVSENTLLENDEYGISIDNQYYAKSENNLLYGNHFIANYKRYFWTSQAYDVGINNKWYNPATLLGNYWSDYKYNEHETYENNKYEIAGSSNSKDPYPIEEQTRKVKSEGFLFLLIPLVIVNISIRRKKTESQA